MTHWLKLQIIWIENENAAVLIGAPTPAGRPLTYFVLQTIRELPEKQALS